VTVSGNGIGGDGATAIAGAIKSNTHLVSLSLSSNDVRIDDAAASRLFFRSLPRSLRRLDLRKNKFSSLPEDFLRLRPFLTDCDFGEGFTDPPQSVIVQGRVDIEAYFEALAGILNLSGMGRLSSCLILQGKVLELTKWTRLPEQ
jgi:hypothetical protein